MNLEQATKTLLSRQPHTLTFHDERAFWAARRALYAAKAVLEAAGVLRAHIHTDRAELTLRIDYPTTGAATAPAQELVSAPPPPPPDWLEESADASSLAPTQLLLFPQKED